MGPCTRRFFANAAGLVTGELTLLQCKQVEHVLPLTRVSTIAWQHVDASPSSTPLQLAHCLHTRQHHSSSRSQVFSYSTQERSSPEAFLHKPCTIRTHSSKTRAYGAYVEVDPLTPHILSNMAKKGVSATRVSDLVTLLDQVDAENMLLESGVFRTVEPEAHELLQQLSSELQAEDGASRLSPADCANIMCLLVLMNHFDLKMKDILIKRVLSDLSNATPHALAQLCYAMGLSGCQDLEFSLAIEKVLRQHSDKFEPTDLAKCLWFFARSSHLSEATDAVAAKLMSRLRTSQDHIDLLYAFWATSEHASTDEAFTNQVIDVVTPRIGDLKAAEVAKFASALSNASVGEKHIYQAISAKAATAASSFHARDLAGLVHALALANQLDKKLCTDLELAIDSNLKKFTSNELDMINQAFNRACVYSATARRVADMGM